ncbi:MAG: hypothetical protein KBC00_00835 [Candidatus Levybacteria bacterium]|nr:hypothetical protein [Candidatus Levybacteria bacterium]MBP9814737.1 hypothetical protein [Candidatus Levybacteria bacterium]
MSQAQGEVKNTPANLDLSAQSKGTELSNEIATKEAVEIEKEVTSGAVSDAAVEETLETSPDIEAAKESVDPKVSQELEKFVQPTSEHLTAQETVQALDGTQAEVTGPTHPVEGVSGDNVSLTQKTTTISDFDALNSGPFGKGDGKVLNKATHNRWKILKWGKLPKILGGKKAA